MEGKWRKEDHQEKVAELLLLRQFSSLLLMVLFFFPGGSSFLDTRASNTIAIFLQQNLLLSSPTHSFLSFSHSSFIDRAVWKDRTNIRSNSLPLLPNFDRNNHLSGLVESVQENSLYLLLTSQVHWTFSIPCHFDASQYTYVSETKRRPNKDNNVGSLWEREFWKTRRERECRITFSSVSLSGRHGGSVEGRDGVGRLRRSSQWKVTMRGRRALTKGDVGCFSQRDTFGKDEWTRETRGNGESQSMKKRRLVHRIRSFHVNRWYTHTQKYQTIGMVWMKISNRVFTVWQSFLFVAVVNFVGWLPSLLDPGEDEEGNIEGTGSNRESTSCLFSSIILISARKHQNVLIRRRLPYHT